MTTYWILFLLPACWRFMAGLYPQFKKFGIVLIALVLIFIVGLRDQVGCDWFNYLKNFNDIARDSLSGSLQNYEPGHVIVNAAADSLGLSVHATNFVYAIIFVLGFLAFLRRQPVPWLAMLMAVSYLIIVVAMGYTRQATAIGLLCLAFNACVDRRVVATVAWVIVASLFHKSALLFLCLVPAAREFRFDVVNLGTIPFALAGFVFMQRDVDQYVQGYVQSGMASEGGPARLILTALAGGGFFVFRKTFAQYRDYYLLILLAAMAVLSLPATLIASTAADRLALYLLPFQISVMSRLPLFFRGEQMRNVIIAGLVALYAGQQYVWLNYATNSYCWVPYKNLIFNSL